MHTVVVKCRGSEASPRADALQVMSPLFHVPGVTFGLWADAAMTPRRVCFGRGGRGLVARVVVERLCPNEVRALASAARNIGGAGPVLAGVRLVMPLGVQVPGGNLGLKANTSYARRHLRCRMASWGLLPLLYVSAGRDRTSQLLCLLRP